jgi:hypothetical protein
MALPKTLCFVFAFIFLSVTAFCNTDRRTWHLADGTTVDAELVSCDLEKREVILKIKEEKEKVFVLDKFSLIDTAWLVEWVKVSKKLEERIKNMKGDFNHYQHHGEYIADFYVYTPSKYRETTKLPMMILFHPGGKGMRYLQRYMDAAEELGIIIVSSDAFRNTNDAIKEEAKMLETFKELLPTIEKTVPHDKERLYMGGSSGGAWRAYHYSVQVDRPWKGILANGGWLGGKKYSDWNYPAGMKVAIVNGNNDKNANSWVRKDVESLTDCGCILNIFAFEGGHQVPPLKTQIEVLKWLLENDEEKNKEEE